MVASSVRSHATAGGSNAAFMYGSSDMPRISTRNVLASPPIIASMSSCRFEDCQNGSMPMRCLHCMATPLASHSSHTIFTLITRKIDSPSLFLVATKRLTKFRSPSGLIVVMPMNAAPVDSVGAITWKNCFSSVCAISSLIATVPPFPLVVYGPHGETTHHQCQHGERAHRNGDLGNEGRFCGWRGGGGKEEKSALTKKSNWSPSARAGRAFSRYMHGITHHV